MTRLLIFYRLQIERAAVKEAGRTRRTGSVLEITSDCVFVAEVYQIPRRDRIDIKKRPDDWSSRLDDSEADLVWMLHAVSFGLLSVTGVFAAAFFFTVAICTLKA